DRARDDGHAARGRLGDRREHLGALGVREVGGLTGRAEREEAVRSALDEVVDEALEARVVDRAVGRERGRDRGNDAGEGRGGGLLGHDYFPRYGTAWVSALARREKRRRGAEQGVGVGVLRVVE